MYHLQHLFHLLARCVSAKFIKDTPARYHDEYLNQIGNGIIKGTEDYLYAAQPLGHIDLTTRRKIVDAIQNEVQELIIKAQGESKTFSDWHTVIDFNDD